MRIKKILLIKLRAMGDTVLMTAPLEELKKAHPGAEIHVLVTAPWHQLLEGHPAVDRVWGLDRREAGVKGLAAIAYRLRRQKFDAVVNFHASPTSALLAVASGARTRSIHFHGHKDRNRFSTVEIPGKGQVKPVIERDMDAVRALGLAVEPGSIPRLHLSESEKAQGRALLEDCELKGPVLGIGLGASRPTKSWPVERYAELAIRWCQETPGGVLALAGPSEAALASRFLRAARDILSATVPDADARAAIRSRIHAEHDFKLRQMASVISQFAVFAANDSGPKHVAVSLGTPTVTVFGPEDPFEWHPYPRDRHPLFFIEGLPCRKDAQPGMPPWCGLQQCTKEHHKCMTQVGVAPVLEACLKHAPKEARKS